MARPPSQWLNFTSIYANCLINGFCEAVVCVSRLRKTARSHGDVLFFSSGKLGTFPGMRFPQARNTKTHPPIRLGSPRLAPGAPGNPTRPPTSCVIPAALPTAASGTNPGKLCIKLIEKRRFHCAPLCSQVAVSQSKPSIGNGRRRWNCILVRAPCVIASLPGSPLELRSHDPTVRRKHREQ